MTGAARRRLSRPARHEQRSCGDCAPARTPSTCRTRRVAAVVHARRARRGRRGGRRDREQPAGQRHRDRRPADPRRRHRDLRRSRAGHRALPDGASRAMARDDISVIYSHPQSLGQCREYLETHYPQVRTEAALSNAAAVEEMLKCRRTALRSRRRGRRRSTAREILERGHPGLAREQDAVRRAGTRRARRRRATTRRRSRSPSRTTGRARWSACCTSSPTARST